MSRVLLFIVAVCLVMATTSAQQLFERDIQTARAKSLQSSQRLKSMQPNVLADHWLANPSKANDQASLIYSNRVRSLDGGVFSYFSPNTRPICYDPTSNVVAMIYNLRVYSQTGDSTGVSLQLFHSTNGGVNWNSAARVLHASVVDYQGMPQICVYNPLGATNISGLGFLTSSFYYPKSAAYNRHGSKIFISEGGSPATEYPIPGPEGDNRGYLWGEGALTGFTHDKDGGGIMATLLSRPAGNTTLQYGLYGSLVLTPEVVMAKIPAAWDYSQFRQSTSVNNYYSSPIIGGVDNQATMYAAVNDYFTDDEMHRVVAFSKSSNMGETWSAFTRLPVSTTVDYAVARGAESVTPYNPYSQDAMIVTGPDRFSYFFVAGLVVSTNIVGLDLVEAEYDNGNWTMRLVDSIAGVPIVFYTNDSTFAHTKAYNYSKLVLQRDQNPLGNEVEAAVNADGSKVIVKWVDYNLEHGVTVLNPAQTVLDADNNDARILTENSLDSLYTTDIYCAERVLSGGTWANPKNLSNDTRFDFSTKIPHVVPTNKRIPMIQQLPLTPAQLKSLGWRDVQYGNAIGAAPAAMISRCPSLPIDISTTNFDPAADVDDAEELSEVNASLHMSALQPNVPTQGMSEISYSTLGSGHVRISCVNTLGETVATIFDGNVEAGHHGLTMDTSVLPSGSYYVTVSMNGLSQSKPLIVVR